MLNILTPPVCVGDEPEHFGQRVKKYKGPGHRRGKGTIRMMLEALELEG